MISPASAVCSCYCTMSEANNGSAVCAPDTVAVVRENKNNFLDARWKALEQKQFADCSFLVGPEDGETEIFHGIQADLMIVSGFMEKLFTSPLRSPFPIRITNMEPIIFKMIMEFAYMGVVREPLRKDDDAVELTIAADYLLMDSMKDVCTAAIRSMVTEENVWSILKRLSVVKLFDVAAGCYQLLEGKIKECLNREEFISASPDIVLEILKRENLQIPEKQLLEYCCKWARNQACFRDAMRALLPHLRLLTLSPAAEDVLHSFLTTEEQLHVLHFNMFKTFRTNFPDTLNTKIVERTPSKLTECRVNFIPDESVSKNFEHLKEEDVFIWFWSQRSCQKNVVTLTANTDIYLTGFECLGSFPANRNSNLKYNKVTRSFQLQPDCTPLPMHILKTSFSISPPYYKIPSVVRYRERKFGYLNIFDSAQFIPKGLPLTLEITMLGGDLNWVSRRFWQIKDSTVNEFLRVNGCQDFGQIQVVQCGISPVFIKNIRYIKVDETQK